MKKSCFVAPIYSAKYNFAENMVRSYNQLYDDDHLFLVFSDESEKRLFETSYPGLRYRPIVYTDDPDLLEVESNPAAQKKFFGIKYIFDNTDFERIGMIDDDSKFFKSVDYDELFIQHLNKKTVFSTYIPVNENLNLINKGCLRFYGVKDQEKLATVTMNFNTFFWFNDIPVFDRTNFYDFYEYMNLDRIKNEFTKYDFEHILYIYYLLITNRIKMNVVGFNLPVPYGGFVELQRYINPGDFDKIYRYMEPMWILSPIDDSAMKNTFMMVHVDR
jgi:hypothetical protein